MRAHDLEDISEKRMNERGGKEEHSGAPESMGVPGPGRPGVLPVTLFDVAQAGG